MKYLTPVLLFFVSSICSAHTFNLGNNAVVPISGGDQAIFEFPVAGKYEVICEKAKSPRPHFVTLNTDTSGTGKFRSVSVEEGDNVTVNVPPYHAEILCSDAPSQQHFSALEVAYQTDSYSKTSERDCQEQVGYAKPGVAHAIAAAMHECHAERYLSCTEVKVTTRFQTLPGGDSCEATAVVFGDDSKSGAKAEDGEE